MRKYFASDPEPAYSQTESAFPWVNIASQRKQATNYDNSLVIRAQSRPRFSQSMASALEVARNRAFKKINLSADWLDGRTTFYALTIKQLYSNN